MIQNLKLNNVGPASEMAMDFGKRLNLITGDNGLGKSFLLDIVWWSLTRKWASEINPKLTTGNKARPSSKGEAKISFSFAAKSKKKLSYESIFHREEQSWLGTRGRPANPGLVLYAMSDGSFAVWDPHRNYWITRGGVDIQERVPAYVFSPKEVWDGLQDDRGNWLCNGLIRDWAGWQKEKGKSFKHLKQVLSVLSSSDNEKLEPGELARISLDDVRDIPTIRMPYQKDVPVVHASSGIRRIIALAYFLVWAWEEHGKAAKQLGKQSTAQITFLVDEIESHLHPSWQRRIIPALLSVMKELTKSPEVQLITATHSPLIMASVEPLFDENQDAWFDLDFENEKVVLRKREYEKRGNIANWLTSEAFDLPSDRGAVEYERLVNEASELLKQVPPSEQQIESMNDKLVKALNPKDDFLFRWRAICYKKGLLK
ncbi:ATP-binding protein [Geovibrio thiophilus]|uniref:ATP-binding protein n=1 Tax=Geovibrio thiophilus TaxID=139438 RepID=A0A410JW81_9BACT|nr:ATP-binding protein [Geovibrio thiophilus]QAR32285.1 ATP-binding protein [Geovibrio thiophilus]